MQLRPGLVTATCVAVLLILKRVILLIVVGQEELDASNDVGTKLHKGASRALKQSCSLGFCNTLIPLLHKGTPIEKQVTVVFST